MPLTPQDYQFFLKHIQERVGNIGMCPFCKKSNQWEVDVIAGPDILPEDASYNKASRLSYPMVAVVCSNCYYVAQFAWRKIKPMR